MEDEWWRKGREIKELDETVAWVITWPTKLAYLFTIFTHSKVHEMRNQFNNHHWRHSRKRLIINSCENVLNTSASSPHLFVFIKFSRWIFRRIVCSLYMWISRKLKDARLFRHIYTLLLRSIICQIYFDNYFLSYEMYVSMLLKLKNF